MEAVIVRKVELPSTVKGVVAIDENGDFNVYINSNLMTDVQLKAYEHEARHIMMNHFHSDKDLDHIEREASHEKGCQRAI